MLITAHGSNRPLLFDHSRSFQRLPTRRLRSRRPRWSPNRDWSAGTTQLYRDTPSAQATAPAVESCHVSPLSDAAADGSKGCAVGTSTVPPTSPATKLQAAEARHSTPSVALSPMEGFGQALRRATLSAMIPDRAPHSSLSEQSKQQSSSR